MIFQLNWKEELSNITGDFKKSFGNLDQKQLNWKPSPDKWSIAQVVDHLIHINDSYIPVIENLNSQNRTIPVTGRFDFLVNYIGDFIFKSVEPTRGKKIKTFPVWEPAGSDLHENIINKFEESQQRIINTIEKNKDKFTAVISSPANKYVVYKFGKAVDILIMHEKRHYNQALEMKEMLNERVNKV